MELASEMHEVWLVFMALLPAIAANRFHWAASETATSEQQTKERANIMAKFMSSHTVPAGALTREQINQIAQAAQNDPTVQPYRSFSNLSEGKIVCVMEAPDEQALATWFKKMQMPCDSIALVELEGERGTIKEA
jgi:hypothetical protein